MIYIFKTLNKQYQSDTFSIINNTHVTHALICLKSTGT